MSLETLARVSNPVTPAIWVDTCTVAMRGDIPVAMIQFFHLLPEAAVEVARIQTSQDSIKAMINLFARLTDYYPARPAKHDDIENDTEQQKPEPS